MDATRFLLLLVQSTIQLPHMVGYELDEETQKRMKQREQQLSREMTRLLQEMEQKTQEQSSFAWGALFFSALQQWQFWAIAGVVVVLFGLCWWLRKRSHQPDSSSEEGSSRKKDKQEEKSSVALDVRRISTKHLLDLSEAFPMVKDLMDELLCMCRKLSGNSFVPQVQPAIGAGSSFEGCSPHELHAVYHLLVPLKPPCGHAFHLELGTTEEMPTTASYVRVELECTCTTEQLREDMLCFLHHPKEELRRNQGASLLGTLCTGPYLDIEKTTRWFQILVRAAWVILPQSRHYRLTVLPARSSCKLRLMDASNNTVLIRMKFGVQQGDFETFLSIE